jgi:hypothetical protein
MSFLKDIVRDLKNESWAEGTSDEQKNKYRMKIVYLMLGLAVAAAFVHPLLSIIPLAVAGRKYMIIRKSS